MIKSLLLVYCLTMTYGCKKNPLDYRSKYIGEYHFTFHEIVNTPLHYSDTAYFIEGTVDYGMNSSSITISFSPSDSLSFSSIEATVYEDGTLTGFRNNHGSGEFLASNKMKYHLQGHSVASSYDGYLLGERK